MCSSSPPAIALALLLFASGCASPTDAPDAPPPPDGKADLDPGDPQLPPVIRLLQVNLGNSDVKCFRSSWRLCQAEVEARAAERIAELAPDVVFVQEVLPDGSICQEQDLWPNWHACSLRDTQEPDQIRRLLGPDFTIVCDPHYGWDCIGLRTASLDEIAPDHASNVCPLGAYCTRPELSARPTEVAPYEAQYVNNQRGDEGFHIMSLDVRFAGVELRLVNLHPESGIGFALRGRERSRAAQLEEALSLMTDAPRVLMAGDSNLDPFRYPDDVSVPVWNSYVDRYDEVGALVERGLFRYHSGPVEEWPPPPTVYGVQLLVQPKTLDHVVSNFARGQCQTLTSDEDRIDQGEGMDHRGLICELELR